MAFVGSVVFLSRNLVPPEAFSSLVDVLSQNGAEVCRCCDPSRNAPNEFHVLFSPDSEKFDVLRANGCQIVGPHCVLRCARERKPLPRVYSCCLAMEGIKILPTGFNSQEKLKIEQLVVSMGGTLEQNVSCADFVVAKTVMSSKYKLACRLEKPVVTFRWLLQCCREHRLAPQEPHKLPVFMGLVICATQIVPDARRKIYDAAVQHGGVFSPDLTKECTHLIANTPDGDKYKVAKSWGTVKIVSQEWFWRSISLKTCMDETDFPVPAVRNTLPQVKAKPVSPVVNEAPVSVALTTTDAEPEPEPEPEPESEPEPEPEPDTEPHIETVSEPSNDQLFLANCRVYLVGFDTTEMRRLVKMVLDGGGARYMELNRTITHVVLGQPSESDLKKVELAVMWGAIHVVTPLWLEECMQQQREILVTKKHIASLSKRKEGPFQTSDKVERSTLNTEESRGSDVPYNVRDPPASKPMGHEDASGIFQGREFKFLGSFPLSKRDEICQWILEGGGAVNQESMKPDYLIGPHGSSRGGSNVVSSHWVKDCLQEKKLLDVAGHVLYRPLTCRVPLPGFQSFKFCISSYAERDRLLCRNLCYVLGAKFTENLTGKVTHLICRFAEGEKYKAATLRGIRVVTMEWLYACAAQNAVVAVDDYDPKPNTGDTVTTQYPSQAARLAAGEWVESPSSGKRKQKRTGPVVSQKRRALSSGDNNSRVDFWDEPASWPLSNEANKTSQPSNDQTEGDKENTAQAFLSKASNDQTKGEKENTAQASASCAKEKPEEAACARQAGTAVAERAADADLNVDLIADDEESVQVEIRNADPKQDSQPDVAAAIENLLAQTGMANNGDRSPSDEEEILSDTSLRSRTSMLSRITSRLHQAAGGEPVGRLQKEASMEVEDKFEESQVCSQIVAYDEDHSERQLIMDRLRSGSSRSVKKSTLSRSSGLGRLFEAAEANK